MQTENVNAAYALGRVETWLEEWAKQKGIGLQEFKAEVIKLLMNGDVITAEREVVRKLRGPYKTRANQTEEERKRLDRERKRVYRLRSKGAVRGWGNMTAEERSVEMIHRQRVAKGLEPPRPRARQHKRPMGGVA